MRWLLLFFLTFLLSPLRGFSQPQGSLKNIYSSYLRGLLYIQEGNYRFALKELRTVKSLDPNSVEIRIKIASVLFRLGEISQAIKELQAAKRLDPKNIELSLALIFLYSYSQRDKELEEEYEYFLKNARTLQPEDIKLAEYLAQFYFYKKNLPEALKIYEKIVKDRPDYIEGIFFLGYLYEEAGRRKDAIAVWRQGLRLNSEFAPLLNALGYTYSQEGVNLEEAEKMILKALEKEPDNGAYLDSLGWVYFKMGDYLRAEEYLKKANSLLKDPEIYEHLGDLYLRLNNPDEAKKYYLEGLEFFPENKNLKEKLKQLQAIKR